MSTFFEYDAISGIRTDFEYIEETGDIKLHRTADSQHLLDYNARLRNDGLTDKGIKESWWLYAKIPPIVMLKLRNQGINCEDGRHIDRVVQEINEHYPLLKTTEKHVGGKTKQIYLPK